MTGFYISSLHGIPHSFTGEASELEGQIAHPTCEVAWKTSKKFLNDRVFAEDDDYLFLLEGVIFNSAALKKQYGCPDMHSLCICLRKTLGEQFHTALIGNFAGACYEKATDTWVIFANKYCSKAVFYYFDQNHFVVAPLPVQIRDTLRAHHIPFHFNRDAAYLMLTYGFMGTDDTFIQEVKKLEAGCCLKLVNGKAEVIRYHRFHNNAYDLSTASEDEIIEGIDQRFRAAIRLEYDKDLEYGYHCHLRALTGGTDSRACAFVAHSLGYGNAVNYTEGQPNYADEQIARQISLHLNNRFIFMSTDTPNGNHDFLKHIDESVYLNQGLAYYFHGLPSIEAKVGLDRMSFGLRHGGAFSEAILTTGVIKHIQMTPPTRPLLTYSDLMVDHCPKEHLQQYENEDIYGIYATFFNKYTSTLGGILTNDETEAYPGLYPDLVDYCLSIPIALREGYHIYHKWLFTKYPDAKQFKLEKWNARVDDNRLKKWWGKITRYGSPLQYLRCSKNPFPTWIRVKFALDQKIKASSHALYPFDYWYQTDETSRAFMDRYFAEHLEQPVIDEALKKDLQYVYDNSLARPKSMAITVVAAAKLFFGETGEGIETPMVSAQDVGSEIQVGEQS